MSAAFIRAAALARGTDVRGAAVELRARAGLDATDWASLPCFVGSSSQNIGAVEDDPGAPLAPPLDFARELGRAFGVSGRVLSTTSGCTSGLTALQLALDLLHAGAFSHALVLGVELPNRLTLAGFAALGLVPGMTLGHALGALVVSREGRWRIASLAWAHDAGVLAGAAPDQGAILRAIRGALSAARWTPADVELVKLQATGIAQGDEAEAQALRAVFAPVPRGLSLKGELGHTLGASGPAELALLLEKLEPRSERRVLFNLSGFGGQVASLALERSA